jgi:hypothetical protein
LQTAELSNATIKIMLAISSFWLGYSAKRSSVYIPPLGRGVLHPIHVAVLTVNFIRPPMVGVEIFTVRVCSPATIIGSQVSKISPKHTLQ